MLEISNVEIAGWRAALRGMRNPKNSWERSDSEFDVREYEYPDDLVPSNINPIIMGQNDYDLAMRLAKGGPVHAKYRRMIMVWCDINAPLLWWKQFDTYRNGVEKNSCSTMHKIDAKEFELSDFSVDGMTTGAVDVLQGVIDALNFERDSYLETGEKKYWENMIRLLPENYNQKRTVMMSYEVLSAMYYWRRNHKVGEWHEFCKWVVSLPCSYLITTPAQ